MFTTLRSMLRNDEGATLVEYSLVVAQPGMLGEPRPARAGRTWIIPLAILAVAAIAAMTLLGKNVSALFTTMGSELTAA